jgi:hypothetical protein
VTIEVVVGVLAELVGAFATNLLDQFFPARVELLS